MIFHVMLEMHRDVERAIGVFFCYELLMVVLFTFSVVFGICSNYYGFVNLNLSAVNEF